MLHNYKQIAVATLKGFPYGLGAPQGMWRLKFNSDVNISVLSYIRASDGFLTSLDGSLPVYGNNQYSAHFFNPASNQNQRSRLRFINTDKSQPARVKIRGVDDEGQISDQVFFTVPAGFTKVVNTSDLETGEAEDLSGSLGNGQGKWNLHITTEGSAVQIMNLLESPNGYISNLSTP